MPFLSLIRLLSQWRQHRANRPPTLNFGSTCIMSNVWTIPMAGRSVRMKSNLVEQARRA